MRFNGKTALVTGGRTGIGRAIAQRLAAEGARVMTAQRGDDEEFDSIRADFTDPESPQQVIDAVIARTGQLDILVNNVGMMQEARIEDMTFADWQRNLALNLSAPFLTIKAALPHLRRSQGVIVNTGSIEGIGTNPNHAAYSATKAGLHGLTRAVAVDHGAEGIRCNAVAPGWIDSDFNRTMIAAAPDPDAFARDLRHIQPVDRIGRPEDVAGMVAFLASAEAGFITGQVYAVDGGRMAKLSLP